VTGFSPLLPTPMARTQSGTEVSGESRTGGPMLQEAVTALLPSPTESDSRGGLHYGKGDLKLSGAVRLLPTPRSSPNENRATKRTPSQEAGQHGLSLASEMLHLLPTPVKGDSKGSRQSTALNPRSPQDTLGDLEYRWSGADTSLSSGAGKRWSVDRPSLSALFEEWMLGAPAGWSDPDCLLSATEFSARSVSWSVPTSSTSSGSDA